MNQMLTSRAAKTTRELRSRGIFVVLRFKTREDDIFNWREMLFVVESEGVTRCENAFFILNIVCSG